MFRTIHVARVAALLPLISVSCAAPEAVPESSVRPGVNKSYLDPDMDVDMMISRFEVESRDIVPALDAIIAALEIQPGDRVADIGAGTGLFLVPFATEVGETGQVFAVDIAQRFVDHLTERAQDAGLENVEAVLCAEDSVNLAADTVDLAFVCDTYHHFEYPRSTVTSIHTALSDGGELFIVDFERIPGVTPQWVLDHVRAGKETVIAEIESFGFELVAELEIEELHENYALRFTKR